MRVVGIDPGTKSFDVVALEGDRAVHRESIDTRLVAEEPSRLLQAIDRMEPDYVVAPSGYGVPVTFGDEVLNARRLAVEVLLLSTEEDLRAGVEAAEPGIMVYEALASTASRLVEAYGGRVLFVPAVIHLPTVPWHRKVNRVDMGTADKLASALLAIYELSGGGARCEDVNAVVVELGYGYAAAVAVEGGRVVDGVGGTSASVGTLTAGALDLEVVAGSGLWRRWDVFYGGVFHVANVYDLGAMAEGYERGEEPYASAFEAFIEGVAKDVSRARVSTPRADVVVVTGRHGAEGAVLRGLRELLEGVEVVRLRGLRGAEGVKEAAQGYAAVGSGLVGEEAFKGLVEHAKVWGACGTAVDYLFHPRARGMAERVARAYVESVARPRLSSRTLSLLRRA